MKSEYGAHISMQQSKEQVARDCIAERKAQARIDEQLRKDRVNSAFWCRVRRVLTVIAIAIVIYTLINFA